MENNRKYDSSAAACGIPSEKKTVNHPFYQVCQPVLPIHDPIPLSSKVLLLYQLFLIFNLRFGGIRCILSIIRTFVLVGGDVHG